MPAIRQDIGICLQHDCLFPQLTVREHIQFFSRLKGLYGKLSFVEVERQVDQALIDVALSEKRNTLSKNLSGGMKRKLSVAIAFCGGSKVVMLDEPTSGMDPFSRRFTWNVIRHYRKDRIIVLTTHFMDEADILGDRIAIMAEGQLRCVGSSLFLKKTYGVGYQLTIDKGQSGVRRAIIDPQESELGLRNHDTAPEAVDRHLSAAAQNKKLKCIVKDAVREASVLSEVGSELSYQLPLSAAPAFAAMFAELDTLVEQGAISCYGVSITTLNEVFLLVTRGETIGKQAVISSSRSLGSSSLDGASLPNNFSSNDRLGNVDEVSVASGALARSKPYSDLEIEGLFARHVVALLKKRASYFRRDRKAWICTTIVPSVFVLIGFLVFLLTAPSLNVAPLTLNLNDYNAAFGSTPISFNSQDSDFICQPGICSHLNPLYRDELTNENYVFCGFEANLGVSTNGFNFTNQTCSIDKKSIEIISGISNAVPDEAGVRNVSEVRVYHLTRYELPLLDHLICTIAAVFQGSLYLLTHSDVYESSKYGAIWFSHFQDSMTNNAMFNESSVNRCMVASPLLNYSSSCNRFGGVGYTLQYNFTALHSAVLYEKLANEALVRHATTNPDFTVETTIAPLPTTAVESNIGAGENGFLVWFLVSLVMIGIRLDNQARVCHHSKPPFAHVSQVIFSFPFIGGAFASFVVHEKSSKAKHLQTVAGVEPSAYWLSTLLWDTINYQIPLWTTIALMSIFNVNILTTRNRDVFSGVIAILFLFGPALAGFTYCVSFSFKSASMCNVFVIIGGFLIGMGGVYEKRI